MVDNPMMIIAWPVFVLFVCCAIAAPMIPFYWIPNYLEKRNKRLFNEASEKVSRDILSIENTINNRTSTVLCKYCNSELDSNLINVYKYIIEHPTLHIYEVNKTRVFYYNEAKSLPVKLSLALELPKWWNHKRRHLRMRYLREQLYTISNTVTTLLANGVCLNKHCDFYNLPTNEETYKLKEAELNNKEKLTNNNLW